MMQILGIRSCGYDGRGRGIFSGFLRRSLLRILVQLQMSRLYHSYHMQNISYYVKYYFKTFLFFLFVLVLYVGRGIYNDMFGKLNYSRKVAIVETLLLLLSILSTLLLGWSQAIEQPNLRLLALGGTGVTDISVCLGIMVSIQLEGAIIVFYLFKSVAVLYAEEYTIGSIVLSAFGCYALFKIGTILVTFLSGQEEGDYREVHDRPRYMQNEQKRRAINIIFFTIGLLVILRMGQEHDHNIVLFGSLFTFVGVGVQLCMVSQSIDLKFKLISTSLSYNIYFFLLGMALVGKLYFNSYLHFTVPTIIYLTVFFFIARVSIGSRSNKFHKSDMMFFEGSYLFKGDKGHKIYRSNKNSERTLRAIDRLSREMLVPIYFLSFIAAVQSQTYFWLPFSIYLMNAFSVQNSTPTKIVAQLQKKLNVSINLKTKLTVPIAILTYLILSKENSRKQRLFDQIHHCTNITQIQIIFLISLILILLSGNFLSASKKSWTLRTVQLLCPLSILFWVIWLQCLHFKIILLGIYVLCFLVQSITVASRGASKGGKST